jgi:ADP-ribose pyrophosphatase
MSVELPHIPNYQEAVPDPAERLRLTRAGISPRSLNLLQERIARADDIARFTVPDDKVSWEEPYPEYRPPFIDVPYGRVTGKDADTLHGDTPPKRLTSWEGSVQYDEHGFPLNPAGRTGMRGRLTMNQWGATPCADAIITREGNAEKEVLMVVRGDNGLVALPAGKLDPGEISLHAAERETREETGLEFDFNRAKVIFSGVVDDDRATDNAWFETAAYLLEVNGDEAAQQPIGADDAVEASWMPLQEALRKPSHASTRLMLALAFNQSEL